MAAGRKGFAPNTQLSRATSATHNRRFAKPNTRDPATGIYSVVTPMHINLLKPTGYVMHQHV